MYLYKTWGPMTSRELCCVYIIPSGSLKVMGVDRPNCATSAGEWGRKALLVARRSGGFRKGPAGLLAPANYITWPESGVARLY